MGFDSIVGVVASEMDSIFYFLPNERVACYLSAGDEYSNKACTKMTQGKPYTPLLWPFSLIQYSNKFYWHIQRGLNAYEINGTSIDYFGQSYTPKNGAFINDYNKKIYMY